MKTILILGLAAAALALGGCGSSPPVPAKQPPPAATAKKGGYYLDDGPEANPPANLDAVPDAEPRDEPLHRFANRPYVALGNAYTPQRPSAAPIAKKAWPRGTAAAFTAGRPRRASRTTCTP